MTIYNGNLGSINCYYKRKLICSVGLSDKQPEEYYWYAADAVLKEGLRKGRHINTIKKEFKDFIKNCRYKEFKKVLTKEDRETILICFINLCRLKVIDYDAHDEGILVMPRSKNLPPSEQ